MLKKIQLPFWLGIMLGLLLGMLIILIATAPQTSQQAIGLETTKYNKAAEDSVSSIVSPVSEAVQPASEAMLATHQITPSPTSIMASTGYTPTTPSLIPTPQTSEPKNTSIVSTQTVNLVEQGNPQETPPLALTRGHGLALVIDDVGYDLSAVKRLLNLSAPMAMSILPEAPFAHQSATLANQAGQVVMLHLPMQPEDSSIKLSPAFLQTSMQKEALRNTFLRDLEKVPYAEGVNNHMGSKLTQLDTPMQWVMQICQEKRLFFVDSRTSANSVAAKVAQDAGVAWASRSIFLDHEMTEQAMLHAWQRARKCAKKKLSCIVIAHPRRKTVAFLEKHLSQEDAASMVSIKHLLRTKPNSTQISHAALP